MKNKRGQELSTNTIILLVLGLIILVVLALGFFVGWNKIFPFLFSNNNVENVKTACTAACTTSNQYDFCTLTRTLKATDLPAGTDGKPQKSVTKSCNFFATTAAYVNYGIEDCPTITCPSQ